MAASMGRSCSYLKSLSIRCLKNFGSKEVYRTLTTKRSLRPYLKELYRRRREVGPEPVRHPSAFGCWNYDSEIFAFGKRLDEEFDEHLLKKAFTTSSFVEAKDEEKRNLGLDVEEEDISLKDNTRLARTGEEVCSKYIKAFLRHSYPFLFEEAISDIHDYLMSDEILKFVSQRIGTTDLIMAMVYPPSDEDCIKVFKAVVGALAESKGEDRAGNFVKDFVIVQLVGKDINELWNLVNPMGALTKVLQSQGRGPPEPRLLWQSGVSTMLAVYYVGIYSDKQLLGKSAGETVTIAEEMAARNALKNLMGTDDGRKPMKFDSDLSEIPLDFSRVNPSLKSLKLPR